VPITLTAGLSDHRSSIILKCSKLPIVSIQSCQLGFNVLPNPQPSVLLALVWALRRGIRPAKDLALATVTDFTGPVQSQWSSYVV